MNLLRELRSFRPALSARQIAWLVRMYCWGVALVLAVLQAWAFRHDVGGDGVNYLDMGDAYFRGDWSMAVNALWSPLYSWLLTLGLHIVKPPTYWEYSAVHGVNLAVYLLALVCFELFLGQFIQYYRMSIKEGQEAISVNTWRVIGYTIFIWSSLDLIGLRMVNPDMLVAGLIYLSFALLLRISQDSSRYTTFILLGLVLGIGYLAKTIILPLAPAFLVASIFSVGNLRRALPKGFVVFFVLLLVVAPFVVALSRSRGHITIGESGKLNYAWHVNRIPDRHWQGDPPGSGVPLHPTRKLLDRPATYEFSLQWPATYPMWYDPPYWYEGVSPKLNWKQQAKALTQNVESLVTALFGLSGGLIIGLFVLIVTTGRAAFKQAARYSSMLVPAVVPLFLYALVHVETRYVAPFLAVIFLVAFASVRLSASKDSKRLITAVAAALSLMLFNPFGASASRRYYSSAISILRAKDDSSNIYWKVARELNRLGIEPGDKVASTTYANYHNVSWARLARVQIIAEVYYRPGVAGERKELEQQNSFWGAGAQIQQQIICLFANAGAKAIIADDAPAWAMNAGWVKLGDTGYLAYLPSAPQDCSQHADTPNTGNYSGTEIGVAKRRLGKPTSVQTNCTRIRVRPCAQPSQANYTFQATKEVNE